jgi:hypothetical protein
MVRIGLKLFMGLALLALGGCAAVPRPHPRSALFDSEDGKHQMAQERAHLGGARPRLGLALSGGGTKAAVFSHGVLHGLHDAGILEHVDAISTTSGGGYAAFWYFSKRLELGDGYAKAFADCFPAWMGRDNQAELLDVARREAAKANLEVCEKPHHLSAQHPGDPYRWQAHLVRWPDVFKPGITSPEESQQVFPGFNTFIGALATIIEGPVRLIGLRKESYVAVSYQYGIERTWGLNPKARTAPEKWEYTNETREDERFVRQMLHVDPQKMQWHQLRTQYGLQKKLPLWILNTAEGQKVERNPNPLNLFELTPFGYGSPQWGYVTEDLSKRVPSIATGVRASAAFADSQGLGNGKQARWLEGLANVFPALSWGVPFEHPHAPQPLRLSDGGGADNLALVSLVRRGLDDVVVVDAAQDASGRMDDLCWSRGLLARSGFTLDVPHLADLDKVCASQIDPPPLPKEPIEGPRGYNVSAWLNPVLHGTITHDATGKVTNMWLIKAAWNEQAVWRAAVDKDCGFGPGRINCLLAMFWNNEFDEKRRDYLPFPQHGTAALTANGRSSVMLAYRELGRMLAQHLVRGEDGRFSLRQPNCKQPSVVLDRRHEGERAEPWPGILSTQKIPSCTSGVASR